MIEEIAKTHYAKKDYPDFIAIAKGAKPQVFNITNAHTMGDLEFRNFDQPQYPSPHVLRPIDGAVTGWTPEAEKLYNYQCIPFFYHHTIS